jgi:hypothetical protein
VEALSLQVYLGVRCAVVQGGWKNARLHSGYASDEAVDPGGTQGVTNLGFEGGEHRPVGLIKYGPDGLDLLDVALDGAGGVAF